MFAASKTDSVSSEIPDPQFNYVTMLLHGDGTNGAQNNTFLDSSASPLTITRNGNPTQGSFSPYGSNWSNSFIRSASSYITISDSSAFSLGTSDFTIECWIFPTLSGSTQDISGQADSSITTTSRSFLFQINGTGNIIAGVWSGSTGYTITSSSAVSFNTWNHIAFVRSSGTLTLYINGVSVGTSSISTASVNDSSNNLSIGRFGERNTAYYDGYVSNFRMVVGTAIYTGSFTPSTTPLTAISGTALLTCADNRFIDDSTNNFAITANGTPSVQRFNPFGTSTAYSTSVIGGSGYFDGSGDYIYSGTGAALNLSTGDYTIECWFYPTSLNASYTSCVQWNPSINNYLGTVTTNATWYDGNIELVGGTIRSNAWNHIAATRSGTSVKLFLNGAVVASGTSSASVGSSTDNVYINTNSGGSYQSGGYYSDVRITKGGALYTAAFTPPTAPLTTTVASGTVSLLTSMTNGAIYDNAMMNDLETVGNAQISTSVKKYGTGSLAFDGTGDWLTVPTSQNFAPGVGDWTIECWLYPISGNWAIVTGSNFYINNNSGTVYVGDASVDIIAVSPPSTGVWTHIAVTKSGSTVRLFYDGTQVGSSTTALSTAITTSMVVGGRPSSSISTNGYIDDLRITKGYARYTATFTPPTSALSDTGPY